MNFALIAHLRGPKNSDVGSRGHWVDQPYFLHLFLVDFRLVSGIIEVKRPMVLQCGPGIGASSSNCSAARCVPQCANRNNKNPALDAVAAPLI
jgi:hypothetical protein